LGIGITVLGVTPGPSVRPGAGLRLTHRTYLIIIHVYIWKIQRLGWLRGKINKTGKGSVKTVGETTEIIC
jgi:hypothetical protein